MSDDPKNPRDSEESLPPDETSRWQRPSEPPVPDTLPEDDFADEPSPAPEPRQRRKRARDRFPMLPDEEPQTAPLKDPPRRPAAASPIDHSGRNRGRNLITGVFLLASCGLIAYFALIWQNPYSALNLLAPPTPLPIVITATYTPTFTPVPSLTLTPSQTYTPSPLPTLAPSLTFTPIFLEGFSTPQGTPVPPDEQGDFPFTLQHDRVIYITNPDARGACNWSSIAGSVMNYDGSALNGYGIHIVGEGVDQTTTTGSAPGFGPGGFEIALGNVARDADFVTQLLDPSGNPASPVYTVATHSECNLNIAALRFVELLPDS